MSVTGKTAPETSSLAVVGSVAIDSVSTPYGKRERSLGGAALHFAVSASFFTDVAVTAVIGEDFTSDDEAVFHEHRIDTENLQRIQGGKTFRWVGEYGVDLNSAKTLDTQLNVFADFKPQLSERIKKSPFLFLANIHPTLQREVREQVDARFTAMDTMNYWIHGTREDLLKTIAIVDALIINDTEVRDLAGESNVIKAAKKVLTMGPKTLIVKRGEYGAALFTKDSYFAVPAFPVEKVFDPTGAGDSFAGGFMGYVSQADTVDEATLRRAIICGSVMASFNIEEFSCDRLRRLTKEEITGRIHQFKDITNFEV